MKNIYLIGDSIRFGAPNSPGYGIYVKEKLDGIANVFAPEENCRFVQYTLRYLHEWANKVDKEKIDIVHWNNGLWDVLRILGDEPLTDIDTYGLMIKRVCQRIRSLFPNARTIFALSTSVMEEWTSPAFIRYNHEIEKYNDKAREVLSEFDIEINDLYSVTRTFDQALRSDWVHFNEKGSKILADKVIEACVSNPIHSEDEDKMKSPVPVSF